MPWATEATAVAGSILTAAFWNTNVRDNANVLKTSLDDAGNFAPPTAVLSVSSGAIAPTLNLHTVDTSGGAGSADLNSLTLTGTIRSGHLVVLSAANLSHVVTVRSGIGNIQLRNGDYVLDAATKFLTLILSGTTWYELSRSSSGGFSSVTTVTVSHAVSTTDSVILGNGTLTVTLPTAVGASIRSYVVKNVGTGVVTVASAGGNVEGASTYALQAGFSITLISDGTNWWVI